MFNVALKLERAIKTLLVSATVVGLCGPVNAVLPECQLNHDDVVAVFGDAAAKCMGVKYQKAFLASSGSWQEEKEAEANVVQRLAELRAIADVDGAGVLLPGSAIPSGKEGEYVGALQAFQEARTTLRVLQLSKEVTGMGCQKHAPEMALLIDTPRHFDRLRELCLMTTTELECEGKYNAYHMPSPNPFPLIYRCGRWDGQVILNPRAFFAEMQQKASQFGQWYAQQPGSIRPDADAILAKLTDFFGSQEEWDREAETIVKWVEDFQEWYFDLDCQRTDIVWEIGETQQDYDTLTQKLTIAKTLVPTDVARLKQASWAALLVEKGLKTTQISARLKSLYVGAMEILLQKKEEMEPLWKVASKIQTFLEELKKDLARNGKMT